MDEEALLDSINSLSIAVRSLAAKRGALSRTRKALLMEARVLTTTISVLLTENVGLATDMNDPAVSRTIAANRDAIVTFIGGLHALIAGSIYQKAAALIDLANDDRDIPEEILDLPNIQRVEKFYLLFVRFDIIWTLNYFALITLNFFEKPLWCSSELKVSCSNRHYYYLGELPYLTSAGSLAFEGVTLIILVAHTLFPLSYEGVSIYWSHHANKLKVILLLFLAADLVVYILYMSPEAIHTLPFRIAPYLRVILLLFLAADLVVYILYMSPEAIHTLPFRIAPYLRVVFFVLYISWLAYVIFEDTQQGTTIFVSYPATLYQLFVLSTTSNNPDAWIPAYNSSRWSFLFFVLFVLLGVYFLSNLVLAVVYESFESGLAKQVTEKDERKERILRRAFDCIDEYVSMSLSVVKFPPGINATLLMKCCLNQQGEGYINKEMCIQLFKELKRYRERTTTLWRISSVSLDFFGVVSRLSTIKGVVDGALGSDGWLSNLKGAFVDV
ncbi:ion transport domain-containing protein [Artemisia annua]|uniref:Ion transport domain-containing protein n=1 Tax=Artemisia annua TaxID=35608 RepID=A0A2U1QDY8_ARTAN|nr:ion transport domain-containing protein [Artemisia annua]